MKNPNRLLVLAAGIIALTAASARAATEPTWLFNNDLQGWTVTAGFQAFDGSGIEAAQATGGRAHDAAHPVFVLTSPEINFNLANVSDVDNVIDILWEGGAGNQEGAADPANLAAVTGYNGGNTNAQGQKGLGFRNLLTGNYDFVDYDTENGGGVETRSYTQADLVANGLDPNASYVLDFFTTDDGGWGWTRLNEVNIDAGALLPLVTEDTDGDGIDDARETTLVGNLTDLGPGDFDGDGVNDPVEINDDNTNPTDPDTDGDGSPDGEEKDRETDPLDADSDNDGLSDGVETNTGTFVSLTDTGTDPLDDDSDGDGSPDCHEIQVSFNPTDPNDTPTRSDFPVVQPSFAVIGGIPGVPSEPDYSTPGMTLEEIRHTGGLDANNPDQNYDAHVNSTISPTSVTVVPYLDHGGGGNAISSNNLPLADIEDFTHRVQGYIDFTGFPCGDYRIHQGADDTNKLLMDTLDGLVEAKHGCCPQDQATDFTLTKVGIFPFDNVAGERGGGQWWDLGISGPGIPGTVALGDTAAGSPPVYVIVPDQADSDGDSLPDAWETSWDEINDLAQLNGTLEAGNGPGDGSGDWDNDGASDKEEYDAGTNPTTEDSDGDGADDGVELANGTDPNNEDTDGDGLLDGVETNTGVFVSTEDTGTSPLDSDSDGDLVNDFDEASNPNRDPNISEAPQAGDITSDLTVYYNFDENLLDQAHLISGTASSAADDLAFTAGHPGTYDTGLFGAAGYFGPGPGGGHAEAPFSADVDGDIAGPSQEITVQWWGRVDAFETGWQIGVGRGEGANWRFHRQGDSNTMAWQGGSNDIHGNANVNDGEWHHFVGTSNGVANVRELWIDGVLMTSTTLTGALNSNPGLPLMIGENPEADNREWNGGIDDVAIWRRALTAEQIQAIYIAGADGQSLGDLISGPATDPLGLAISLNDPDPLTLRAEFNTQPGKQYDILVSPDLSSPRESWAELAGAQDIQADPSGRATVDFAAPFGITGYVAVREESLPPFFTDDFESGAEGWEAVVNDGEGNTQWELGTPAGSTGPLNGANDSANAWSTNLGDYGSDSDISLFSPPLDLTGLPGAQLTFLAWRDGDQFGESASVRFRKVEDNTLLGDEVLIDMTIIDSSFEEISVPFPPEAAGEILRIEFNFVSDNTTDAFSGLNIDDVSVEIAAP